MSLPTTRCDGRCNVCHEQHHELQVEVERLKDELEVKTGACEFNRVAYAQCREEPVALQAQVETLTEERDSANRRLGRQIQDTQDRIAALQQQVSALRDALKDLVWYARPGNWDDPSDDIDKLSEMRAWEKADAAMAQPPESGKGALAKMSPQLRNVLYDLIRKVPPLADHGDQQAMDEFIAEVMPSPKPAPEVKP